MLDQRATLLAPFVRIQRSRAALDRVTHAVRFRAPTAMPKWMERQFFAGIRASKQRLRHYCETTPYAGEAANLGKTSKFDGAFARTFDLKNRTRNFWIGNVCLVSGVEQNQRIVPARVINPAGQLLTARNRAGRIVGKTKINKIDMFLWRLGNEIVLSRAWQINDAFIAAIFSRRAGVARHHIGVDIDGINRISNRDFVLVA